jgi:ATP-binding cassette subfamily B protein
MYTPLTPVKNSFRLNVLFYLINVMWGIADRVSRRWLLAALLCTLFIAVFGAGTPYIFKMLIEGFERQQHADIQWLIFLAFIAVFALSNLLKEAMFYIYFPVEQKLQKEIMTTSFRNILSQKYSLYSHAKIGEITQIFINGENALSTLAPNLIFTAFPLMFEFVFIIILLTVVLPPIYSFIVFATVFGYLVVAIFASERLSHLQKKGVANSIRARGKALDGLNNIEPIEAYSAHSFFVNYYKENLEQKEKIFTRFFKFRSAFGLLHDSIAVIGVGLANYIAFNDVLSQELAVSSLIMVNMYMFQLLYPLQEMSLTYRQLKSQLIHLEDYLGFLTLTSGSCPSSSIISSEARPIKNLALEKATVCCEDHAILKTVSIAIERGEKVVIVGKSGSGKTTLVKTLSGLIPIRNGSLMSNHEIVTNTQLLRHRISVVSQDVSIFNETIRFNVTLGDSSITTDKIKNAAKACHIEHLLDAYLDDQSVGERGSRLSGGERQRLGLARALVRKPDFLFVDEGTSAQDIETQKELIRVLLQLKNVGIACVTHRLELCSNFQRIILIDEGRIVGDGSFSQLMRDNSSFYSFYNTEPSQNPTCKYIHKSRAIMKAVTT